MVKYHHIIIHIQRRLFLSGPPPNTISSTEKNTVYNIAASSQVETEIYKIQTATEGEFYLLENRQKTSFDECLPDSGLLIYHISSDIETAISNNSVNASLPQKCYLVDATSLDALPSDTLSYNNPEMNVFPYKNYYGPTNIFFTSQTTPSSWSWDSVPTGVDICFIQHNGSNMKFVVNPQIEGPDTLHVRNIPDSAWYHIRNVPSDATITWSITNIHNNLSGIWEFVLASSSNTDSVRVAFRQKPANPNPGIQSIEDSVVGTSGLNKYLYADLTVTVSNSSTSYSTTKRIKRQVISSPFALRSTNTNNHLDISIQDSGKDLQENRETTYTQELWSPIYGLMRTKVVQSATEQMSTAGLPQGVYVILLKENGNVIAETKVIIQ